MRRVSGKVFTLQPDLSQKQKAYFSLFAKTLKGVFIATLQEWIISNAQNERGSAYQQINELTLVATDLFFHVISRPQLALNLAAQITCVTWP
jgi:hypothetical protein